MENTPQSEFYLNFILVSVKMPSVHYCAFCHGQVLTIDGMKHHYAWKAECRKKFQAEIGKSIITVFDDEIPDPPQPVPSPEALLSDEGS